MESFFKQKRIVDRALLDRVKAQRCTASFSNKKNCFGPIDPHHITTVGSGGGDIESNVMPLCRKHHTEWDLGNAIFLERHPSVRHWLEEHDRFDILDKLDNLNLNFKEEIQIKTGS